MSSVTPDRRTVIRTAAWAVPAVTLVSAAPAFAASPPACMTAATPVTWQTINLTIYTRVRTYASVSGFTNRTDGVSKVDYIFIVPQFIRAGATVPQQTLVYQSTLGAADSKKAYDSGGRTVQSGYVDVNYNFGGGLTPASSPVRMSLNPTNVNMPSNGQLSTRFAGNMPSLTAASAPGTYSITFAPPPSADPVEGTASTWNGSQTVKTAFSWPLPTTATAFVHSMTPTTIPTAVNDWGTQGQAQSLTIANYTVVPAC